MKKQNKGITLVSLVVTIIILIILAGVSINAILGENGIITIAKQAKENMALAKTEEETELNELYMQILAENDENTVIGEISNVEILTEIQNLKNEIEKLKNNTTTLDTMYPVGSIYISTDLSTAEEVATKFGGTWESYGGGRTLVGVGTGTDNNSTEQTFAANESGGEYKHTLTIAEMPSHTHKFVNRRKCTCNEINSFFYTIRTRICISRKWWLVVSIQ